MRQNLFMSQFYAFLTVLLWSSAYVFTKVALESYSVSALALLRCLIASLCLGGALAAKRAAFPGFSSLPRFFVAGACGFGLYILVFNQGSMSLNPTTSCVIISISPILTALLARVRFGEKLGLPRWLAIGLAFGGILVMTLWDGDFHVSGGIAWMLAAALLISLYNILQRSLTRQFEPLVVTAYGFFAGALLLAPFFPEALEQISGAQAHQIGLAVFLGACPSAMAYLAWAKALSLAPSTGSVSNYMFLTPFLALLLEYLVTGAWPGAATFAGGGIIMFSLLIFLWAPREARASLRRD